MKIIPLAFLIIGLLIFSQSKRNQYQELSPKLNKINNIFSVGPCTEITTLIYHHIQPLGDANIKFQTALTIDPVILRQHINYLKTHGYTFISPTKVNDFFDHGDALPTKPVMLTFDDAYKDFYLHAFPILKMTNTPAIIFVPTGLIGNDDYMNWSEIEEISEYEPITIANHTVRHKSMQNKRELIENEIGNAHLELIMRGFNSDHIFAYPYGATSQSSRHILSSLHYSLAFTTTHGNVYCKEKRLELPRIHATNSSLQDLGL